MGKLEEGKWRREGLKRMSEGNGPRKSLKRGLRFKCDGSPVGAASMDFVSWIELEEHENNTILFEVLVQELVSHPQECFGCTRNNNFGHLQ